MDIQTSFKVKQKKEAQQLLIRNKTINSNIKRLFSKVLNSNIDGVSFDFMLDGTIIIGKTAGSGWEFYEEAEIYPFLSLQECLDSINCLQLKFDNYKKTVKH